jgi:hypothetical protein
VYELRAEYRPAPGGRTINVWHVVRDGQSVPLCGHELAPDALTRSIADLEAVRGSRCEACRSAYRIARPPPDSIRWTIHPGLDEAPGGGRNRGPS